MGWSFPWVSSYGTSFNFDFHVSYTEQSVAGGAEHNFRPLTDAQLDPRMFRYEAHGLSSFAHIMHAVRQLIGERHGAAHMDNDTVIRLRRVVLRLARQLNVASREEGLTPTEASVLGIASTKGPLSLAELTEIEGINPTMLSRVVSKLDSFGLIRRLRDPDDFRAARVEVTPEGKLRYERISAQRSAIISDCVAGLPADQEAALVAALPAFENLADTLKSTVRRPGSPYPR